MTCHVMVLPSFACQASCTYCFGPNRGPVMPLDVFDVAVDWLAVIALDDKLDITFHGGEPLLAGFDWYARALPRLRQRFGRRLKLSVQSNLWQLDDALCDLFKEHNVSLGTSLDGPETINDRQRGAGYFARTMGGIEMARRHGLDVGVICTFTRLSALKCQDVFDFFVENHLNFSIHAAVATLTDVPDNELAMSPETHADLFLRLFDLYVDSITRVRISTFDAMAKGISAGQGNLCTFTNCLGHYLTVGPRGEIYSCNRFAQHPEWQLGTVQAQPDLETLMHTEVWARLQAREDATRESCGECAHFAYCRGGCAYNAITAGQDARDPHCPAYKQVFDSITDRALAEILSEENMQAVVQGESSKYGLMRKGKLLRIMRGGLHPQEVAKQARKAVAAVALAVSASPSEAIAKLDRAGLVKDPIRAMQSLTALQAQLESQSHRLVNAYLHVTYACNLACNHCYASSSPDQVGQVMPVESLTGLVEASARAGFGKAVITGGEPLAHPHRDTLLNALAQVRQMVKPMQIVLRTNLAYSLSTKLREQILRSADQIIVSVDGNEATHDARRGAGMYARTVANLKDLVGFQNLPGLAPTIVLAATLTAEQASGPEGDAVRALGEELGVSLRFKPVLPLGRAARDVLTPEFYTSLDDESEILARQAGPRATCGLGMNLYVAPDGGSFPCYALMGTGYNLGNAFSDGLARVLERNNAYRRVTVDSNRQCQRCALRYLCGGFCRAWGSSADPDAPPTDCADLCERAQHTLTSALEALDVSAERWRAAGLP